jgi:hypothetical protein
LVGNVHAEGNDMDKIVAALREEKRKLKKLVTV